jgi:aldehyde:ferredoxin oxidoreductase
MAAGYDFAGGEAMNFGYAGKAAFIDLSSQTFKIIPIEQELKQKFVGGRGFIANWLYELMSFQTAPLDHDSLLIFANGALTGTLAPTSARIAIGARAPETGIWSIGNVGGFFGAQLKRAGWDALIIRGCASKKAYLLISDEKINFKSADSLWGLTTHAVDREIKLENSDQSLSVACIGLAGENGSSLATIMVDRVRSAGRGGLGAVMGSKNLKAIAVHGSADVPIADPRRFYQLSLNIIKRSAKLYFKGRWKEGSIGALKRYNAVGALSTRNAQATQFEEIDGIISQTFVKNFKQPYMRACHACSIPCWFTFYIQDGDFAGAYDDNVNASTFKELGARCGLGKMDAILALNSMCNALGLDNISAPAAISFAMECFQRGILTTRDSEGLQLNWGDAQVMQILLQQMAINQGFGGQLAQGVRKCALQWGHGAEAYALHVKGLETTATDPRGQPSWGLGYATSSRGACHMRAYGNYEYKGMNEQEMLKISGTTKIKERYSAEGKGRAGVYLENLRAIGDAVGMCHLLTRAELGFQEVLAPLYQAATGIDMSPDDLFIVGERINNLERLANLHYGITPQDDTLPKRYLEEPASSGPNQGFVCPLTPMLQEYYQARDWDPLTGIPSRQKLAELGLNFDEHELK